MENKLIKPIIKVGNSGGVLVPREWVNGSAKVELIAKPLNIKSDILEILSPYLEDIMGIYLTGSYARDEQTNKSDVDVLVITDELSNRIKKGKYDILLIKKDDVNNALENDALPIIPMLIEAKPIMGKNLIEDYKKQVKLSKKNLRFYIETGKSILKVNKAAIELDKQISSNCDDSIAYSLILRLRSSYILDCLIKKKIWSNREFLNITRKIAGSLEAYEGYLRVKNDEKTKETLPILEAEKLLNYILKKLKEHEKWLKRRN